MIIKPIVKEVNIIKNITGITIIPFILIRKKLKYYKKYKVLNHNKIHFLQKLETLIIGFYIIWAVNFIINLVIYKLDFKKSIRNICFERECFNNNKNLIYLDNRKSYIWIKLLFNKKIPCKQI